MKVSDFITSRHSLRGGLINNPWENAYWFARILINNDKYGAIGKESKLMAELASGLRNLMSNQADQEIQLGLLKSFIQQIINNRYKKETSKSLRAKLFTHDILDMLATLEDVAVLILTIENVLIPTSEAMKAIPKNDREYTVAAATSYFEQQGISALATVINFWDDAGVKGSLTAERVAVVREFANLRRYIVDFPEYEADLVLTAFVQEFERRLGQNRKQRAGNSLEDVASFILDYFKIKSEPRPEHFQADIEVDKWVRCKDRWLIGISCKRTLRERWKQVSSANAEVLSRFKIRQIWHLITYDEDLSDDKLTLLGELRHVFYLRDDSRKLRHSLNHIGLKNYVRPMSQFVDDIRKVQGQA